MTMRGRIGNQAENARHCASPPCRRRIGLRTGCSGFSFSRVGDAPGNLEEPAGSDSSIETGRQPLQGGPFVVLVARVWARNGGLRKVALETNADLWNLSAPKRIDVSMFALGGRS
jgi:hypothetical protein